MSRPLTRNEMAAPGSEVWRKTITASKVPIILGLSPWQTASELWMEMAGLATPEPLEGEHLDFGHDIEDSLVKSWLRRNPGWQAGKGEIAYTGESLPFPNQVTLDRRARRGRKFRIIECKATSSRNTWGEVGEQLPGSVAAQVITQMGVSGIHEASVVTLAGYDRPLAPRHYEVEWEPDMWAGIVDVLDGFYRSLGQAEPPMPPADLLAALTAGPEREGDTEFDQADFVQLDALLAQQTMLGAQIEEEKASLLARAGDAKRVLVDGKPRITFTKGRFAATRVPDEAKHLLKDPDVLAETVKLDAKKFASKYPEVAAAATAAPTPTFK